MVTAYCFHSGKEPLFITTITEFMDFRNLVACKLVESADYITRFSVKWNLHIEVLDVIHFQKLLSCCALP